MANPLVTIRRHGHSYVRIPKSKLEGAKAKITIDPDIQFGAPCLHGTRTPVQSLYGNFRGGDSPECIAQSRDLTLEQVAAAIEYMEGR